jgi:hypothetical protein
LPRRIKIEWHHPERSQMEAVLARGDRRLAGVVEAVADAGDGFEGWGGDFHYALWTDALGERAPEWRRMLGGLENGQPRPWQHLSRGVSPKFLRDDLKAAYAGQTLADCRLGECYQCGLRRVCDEVEPQKQEARIGSLQPASVDRPTPAIGGQPAVSYRYRLVFSKLCRARYLGHQDMMRAVRRGLVRAGVPLRYGYGFSPRPRVTYSAALPLGCGAFGIWIEFESAAELDVKIWLARLRQAFPAAMRPWSLEQVVVKGERREADVRFRLRFDRPLPQMAGEPAGSDGNGRAEPLDIGTKGLPAGLGEGWSVDRGRRTFVFCAGPEAVRPRAVLEAAGAMAAAGSETGQRVELMSVTRIERARPPDRRGDPAALKMVQAAAP